jgi:hypothetical protein
MGINSYLRYGYDVVPQGGTMVTLPNGKVVNVRLGGWFNYFTLPPDLQPHGSLGPGNT